MFQSKLLFIILSETLTTLYVQMHEFISLKFQSLIAQASLIASWFIAQASIIEQGFDQLFSLGLLIVAVVVIWKAFSRKDESESALLKEQVQMYKELSEYQKGVIKELNETIKSQRSNE